MKKVDVLRAFGTYRAIAEFFRISVQAVHQWKENIPPEREKKLRKRRPELFRKEAP